jgi:hypothetical protein
MSYSVYFRVVSRISEWSNGRSIENGRKVSIMWSVAVLVSIFVSLVLTFLHHGRVDCRIRLSWSFEDGNPHRCSDSDGFTCCFVSWSFPCSSASRISRGPWRNQPLSAPRPFVIQSHRYVLPSLQFMCFTCVSHVSHLTLFLHAGQSRRGCSWKLSATL